jgi:hypothetical protein
MFAGFTFGATARGFFIPAAAFFGGMVVVGVVAWRVRGGEAEAGQGEGR